MRSELRIRLLLGAAGLSLLALSLACSGSSSSGTNTPPAPSGTLAMSVSDASSEDWAQIGVRVMGITLTPQGGGTPVTVYTAPTPAPMLNLVHLDQLSELIGNLQVPAGTYTKATLTISANPGDVTLVSSSNPSAGFDLPASTTVDPASIDIKNATGTAPNLTTTVAVNLVTPLTVTAGQVANLDLEFDLAHPAFIVDHIPAGTSTPVWTVNFNGPVRHHPNYELAGTVLRHAYGQVTTVATDNSSFTMVKEHEVYPVPASGPAPIAGLQTLTIQADSANGTIFYDEDAHTSTVVKSFSAQAASLATKYVRVAARYQSNGTLTAVRVWASSSWGNVWVSPEGHVNQVDAINDVIYVDNENGKSIPILVDANTNFFYRVPANGLADATPIGTGTGFIAAHNIVRGFKVHIGVVDTLAANLVAKTVDIETAGYSGYISSANTTQFTYTRPFANVADSYTITLPYCSATAKNGKDASGNQILGFKWWNFTFPTLADTGASAIPDFVAAVGGSADFGGTFGAMKAWGASYTTWGDGVTPLSTGWGAKWTVLEPTTLPRGTVATPWLVKDVNSGSFGLTLPKGANTVPVTLSTVSGSATLVYDVAIAGRLVTITPVDISTPAGQASLATYIANGTSVKVYGIPQPDGSIKGYALTYFH